MTALAVRHETWALGAPRLLAGLTEHDRLALPEHLATHGRLTPPGLDRLLAALDATGLVGRGGAAFPLAGKLRSLRPGRPVVVVNGCESEPASWKDRTLLRRAPHLVLDGAFAVAAAIGAREVVVAVHDDEAAASLRSALRERPEPARIARIDGGFVAGEARALVRALDGGPALPPGRRVLPTVSGVGDQPTLLSNVETFAQVAVLARVGPARYCSTGSRAEPGSTLLTVGGAVDRPGVVEIPLGTPLPIVLAAAGARDASAVLVGGYHGGWVDPHADLPLDHRGPLGAGVLWVLDAGSCPLGELARVTGWLAEQSAGQCGPCRFGLPALAADLQLLWRGGQAALATAHRHAAVARGACGHPDGVTRSARSGLQLLGEEIDRHVRHGGCGRPVLGVLPI